MTRLTSDQRRRDDYIRQRGLETDTYGTATFTLTATVLATATGSVTNTATVASAATVPDPAPGNNSASDTNTIGVSGDLSITKSNNGNSVTAGATVILESTTYPGTTEELLGPRLEDVSGLTAGADFSLGYSPERIDPGNREHTFVNTPKVVSGVDAASLARIQAFYDTLDKATALNPSPAGAQIDAAWKSAVARALGGQPAQQALGQAQKEAQAAYDKASRG